MAGHRTSTRGVARRRIAVAAGAVGATAAIALAPAAQAAPTAVDSQQVAENNYATWQSLAKILNGGSTAQDAVLGVAAKPLPKGWVPTSTTTAGTATTSVGFVEALAQAATMVVTPVDTSGVPGLPTLAQAGTLPAQLLLGAPLIDPTTGVVLKGGEAAAKITGAVAALNLINGATATANTVADGLAAVPLVRTFKVVSHAGQLTGIPSLSDALALLPSGTRTTTNWTNTVAWPLLQTGGTTWLTNDRLAVDGVTSAQIKDAFGGIGGGAPLVVQPGKDKCGGILCTAPVWQPSGDTVVRYRPWDGVPAALGLLNGIDIPGFSVIQQGVGGKYALPGNGKIGWLGQMTQVIIPAHGDTPATVATVPLTAGGIALPFDLLTAGGLYTPGIVTQSGQSLNATLGSRSFGLSIPRAGLGVGTTSFLENWHVGPDGVNINTGWTVLLPQTGGTGIPALPLIYSMGSYNLGPKGFGVSGPSLFGIGLPSFQVGDTPAAGGSSGSVGDAIGNLQIPTTLISLDPKMLFSMLNVTDVTGLGLTDPFGTASKVLTPLYTGLVAPLATPLWQGGFDVGGRVINDGSKLVKDTTADLATRADEASAMIVDTADTLDTVIPEVPATPLDNVTIKGATDAVDETLDAAEDATKEVVTQATGVASNAGDLGRTVEPEPAAGKHDAERDPAPGAEVKGAEVKSAEVKDAA